MSLERIRLELARDRGFPDGSNRHGYELVVPLDSQGHIDLEAWKASREKCRVHRFWQGEDDEVGHLVRTRRGEWAFHYDVDGDPDEDDTGFRLGEHSFKPGEYVSIREHDGEMRTFRVVSVRPL
ncbi:hypothetical protein [Limibacillus halophilus]|jgi:hypothetical protein